MAVARHANGATFTELRAKLGLPKGSLHRLLQSLEQDRYLTQRQGAYFLDAESTKLAGLITRATHTEEFPASVSPVADWLAKVTGETVVVGILSDRMTEVVYVYVKNSESTLRISVPIGNRRPLYSAASGKIILAYLPIEFQDRYLAETKFEKITPFTSTQSELSSLIRDARRNGIVEDLNSSFVGVCGLASPGLDRLGNIYCAISLVGPIDRMQANQERFRALNLEAGQRVSRILGYLDEYPPLAE